MVNLYLLITNNNNRSPLSLMILTGVTMIQKRADFTLCDDKEASVGKIFFYYFGPSALRLRMKESAVIFAKIWFIKRVDKG